jgi:hypothetical protein
MGLTLGGHRPLRRFAFVALSCLFLVSAGAWAGEAGAASTQRDSASHIMNKSAMTQSLAQVIVQHLSDANTDDDSQNELVDVTQIAAHGPLASYSLVIDIDNPSPIATSQEILANGYPFTFDFEDGLQGWTLGGSAQRVHTQVLGGQWAIFGDGLVEGGARMSIELDLRSIDSIVMDVFFAGEPDFLIPTLTVSTGPDSLGFVEPTRQDDDDIARLIFDVPSTERVGLIFAWGPVPTHVKTCFPRPCPVPEPDARLAFIDNITLNPIPEPSTLLLVALGLGFAARWRKGR